MTTQTIQTASTIETIQTTRPSRRDFLKLAASGAAAWSLAPLDLPSWAPRMAFSPEGQEPHGDLLVCVFQRGGMDGLNVVIPHAETAYYDARPTLAIPEPTSGVDDAAIDLDGFFSLHPALRPFKDIWDEGDLAVVHACGSPDPTHSHFDAMDYMERGTPGDKTVPTGWLGRHLQTIAEKYPNDSPFRAVGMGNILQTSLRGPLPAAALRSIAEFHLQGREDQLAEIQAVLASLYASEDVLSIEAQTTFEAMDILARLDPHSYRPAHGAEYPETEFGLALRQVAQLARAEVGLEIACVDIGGWDTHADQGVLDGRLPDLLSDFASGLAALYHDLGDLNERLTVVTMSEFGRRVQENGNAGTDHGHGNLMFVMGGSVKGGKVHGEWPGLAVEDRHGPGDLAITTDFRDVLGEIVQKRLNNDQLDQVFPGYEGFDFRGVTE